MFDGAVSSIAEAALDRDVDNAIRQHLAAGTRTIAKVTRRTEQRIEAVTAGAVPGRLWRAWKSSVYPKSGPARDPTGTIFVNGGERTKGAMTFWTKPGRIKGKDGQATAIPLPAAGSRGRDRNLTPEKWEAQHGAKLRLVLRPGKFPLLVADTGTLNARTGTYRSLTARRAQAGRGLASVPIFVLVPGVTFRNAVAVEPIVSRAETEIPGEYAAEAAKI